MHGPTLAARTEKYATAPKKNAVAMATAWSDPRQ
jgi:hypothetical protein